MSIFVSLCICLMGMMFYLNVDFFPFVLSHQSNFSVFPLFVLVSVLPIRGLDLWHLRFPRRVLWALTGGVGLAAIVGERLVLCSQHSIWQHTATSSVFSVGPILWYVQKALLTLSREKTSLTSAELREMQEPQSLVSL